jgi:hypothetical protein
MGDTMDLISIADAAKLIERHEKTIRRWIKKQLETDPKAKENIIQEAIASGFGYRINREYLLAHFPSPLNRSPEQADGQSTGHEARQPTGQPTSPSDPVIAAKDETITLLKEQVKQQNEELNRKNEQLSKMLERLREQNILLKGYQDKYLLEAPKERKDMDNPLDTLPRQPTGHETVHSPEQAGQPNSIGMDKNHKRSRPQEKQANAKATHKTTKPTKKVDQEKPQRKGLFSFLRRK